MSGRQMSQTANFPGRQLSLQPNVQERNVLGANCPERQLSGRKMSKAPNVGRQMSGRGLAGAICLPSGMCTYYNSLIICKIDIFGNFPAFILVLMVYAYVLSE